MKYTPIEPSKNILFESQPLDGDSVDLVIIKASTISIIIIVK